MTIEQRLEQDLKAALLGGDSAKVSVLRGLKSSILYAKVAAKLPRDQALADEQLIQLLSKEAKKRQESADLYEQGGRPERAAAELAEKAVIENYLPAQLSEEELTKIIDKVIAGVGASGPAAMGQVIGQVKAETAGAADGGLIAGLVKERLVS